MKGPLPWLTVLVMALAVVPAPAIAAPKAPTAKQLKVQANKLNDEAKAAFRAGQWDRAAELFLQVYDLAKIPTAVYNAARAREQSGKLAEAKALFELFLSIEKSPAGQDDGKKRVAAIEEQLRRLAEEKARAEAEAKARAEAEEKIRQAEERAREAELRAAESARQAREAEMRAQKEAAAKAEAEAKLRVEAESHARAQAEAKAISAEERAKDAERRAKEAEARSAAKPAVLPGSSASTASAPAAVKGPGAAGPAASKRREAEPPETPGESTLLFGAVAMVNGGASLQQSAPEGVFRPDLSAGLGGHVYVSWGKRNTTPMLAFISGAQWIQFQAWDTPSPAAQPSGIDLFAGVAFPRIAGTQLTVHRYDMDLQNGRGSLSYMTAGAKVVVSPNTGYLSLGFEGLIASDRKDQDIAGLDEFGYGPFFRLVLELGVHFGNAALSR
jgi:hypothetical protein